MSGYLSLGTHWTTAAPTEDQHSSPAARTQPIGGTLHQRTPELRIKDISKPKPPPTTAKGSFTELAVTDKGRASVTQDMEGPAPFSIDYSFRNSIYPRYTKIIQSCDQAGPSGSKNQIDITKSVEGSQNQCRTTQSLFNVGAN